MRYKGIIFDLDGVLCSTDQYHYRAWKQMAEREGIYFDENINNRLRGISRKESLAIILEQSPKRYTQEEQEELASYKNERYTEMLKSMSSQELTAEVKETLEELRQRGGLLAIGSSSRNAKLILGQLGLEGYFDAVSDGTNIIHSKPDPEVFLKAAEYLKLEPSQCLVVEDAKAGIDAAKAGGFHSAGLGEAASYEKTDYRLNCFGDLKNCV